MIEVIERFDVGFKGEKKVLKMKVYERRRKGMEFNVLEYGRGKLRA